MRQEQIDEGDGDGREVLNNQTGHPVVVCLKETDPGPGNEMLKLRNTWVKYANSLTHPIDTSTDSKIDEVEGSAQQTQDEHIENKPQQVKPHLLSQLPLSHLHGEPLLLQEQLRSIRENEQLKLSTKASKSRVKGHIWYLHIFPVLCFLRNVKRFSSEF